MRANPIKVAVTYIISFAIPEKLLFMENTVVLMGGNTVYQNPFIALNGTNGTSMTELINKLKSDWDSGNKAAIKISLAALNKAIRRQCLYIDGIADHNETIINNAGFIATNAEAVAAAALLKPAAPVLKHGAVGCINKTAVKLKGAKNYLTILSNNSALPIDVSGEQIVIKPAALTDVIIIDSRSNTKAVYSGLPSGVRMYATTFGFNKLGKSPASDKVDIIVP